MENRYLKDPKIVGATVGLLTFGIGFGIGYILGKRQQPFVHAVPAQDWTLADLKTVPDVEENSQEVTEEAPEALERGAAFIEEKLQEVEPVRKSVFEDVDDDWDYAKELEKRTDQEPYVLHRDEFYNEESGYLQSTLTYYAGDDILVDQEDAPIYNHANIIGPLMFGHGSGDPNVFHVRNDKLKAEYEVLRDSGLYSVEVLGLQIEENARVTDIQHSGDRKFRQD